MVVARRMRSLCTAVALLATSSVQVVVASDDVCSFPLSRMFVRETSGSAPTATLVACVDQNNSTHPRCLLQCTCRETEFAQHSGASAAWGVCVETTTTTGCVPSTTRRQCPRFDPVPASITTDPIQVMALSTNTTMTESSPTTPTTTTPTSPNPTTTQAEGSSASSSSGSTDRTTMIIIVAAVVAVFAVIVVVAIVRARKSDSDEEPTTPLESSTDVYTTTATAKIRARPMQVTPYVLKPHPAQRGSHTHSERTTLASSHQGSGVDANILYNEEEDDVAMLESYAQMRTFNGDTFLSVVNFDDSVRSIDVAVVRRNAEVSDTMLTTASTAYWRNPDDTMLYSTSSTRTFVDAHEPPTSRARAL